MKKEIQNMSLGLIVGSHALSLFFSSALYAESKTFQLKGVHCESCTSAVQEKVCQIQEFKVCKAEVTDASKELGKLQLETQPPKKGGKAPSIEVAKIKKILESSNYTLGSEI